MLLFTVCQKPSKMTPPKRDLWIEATTCASSYTEANSKHVVSSFGFDDDNKTRLAPWPYTQVLGKHMSERILTWFWGRRRGWPMTNAKQNYQQHKDKSNNKKYTSWSTQSHTPNTGWVTQMTLTVHGLAHAIEPQMWGQKGVEQSRAGWRATRYQSRVDPNRGRAGNVWKAAGRQKTALLAFDQAGVTRVTCIQTSSAWVSTLTCEKIDQSHLTYVKRSKLPSTIRCMGH